eukprot:1394291-Rhodomonas_salina.4
MSVPGIASGASIPGSSGSRYWRFRAPSTIRQVSTGPRIGRIRYVGTGHRVASAKSVPDSAEAAGSTRYSGTGHRIARA